MSIVNLSLESFDFKKIAGTASTIRAVGHGLGLLGISFSYLTMYKPKDDPQCTGSMGTACDIARFIFYFFAGIYASGLIGLPWDALVLWATKSLPDG